MSAIRAVRNLTFQFCKTVAVWGMYSLHAITLPGQPDLIFFGKGQHSEEAVRSRFRKEHAGGIVVLGAPRSSSAEISLRYLFLLSDLARIFGVPVDTVWWPARAADAHLYLASAMMASAPSPMPVKPAAELVRSWRDRLGVDQGVMAAMIGCAHTRVHRLEQGKSKLTFQDFLDLRYWAAQVGLQSEFDVLFFGQPENRLSSQHSLEIAP